MKALRFTSGQLSLADIERPHNRSEALVRVTVSGICSTDLEIVRGYAGFEGTIGHEFVGVVEQADDAPQLVGKRVVGEINAGCGSCDKCLSGDPRHCLGGLYLASSSVMVPTPNTCNCRRETARRSRPRPR